MTKVVSCMLYSIKRIEFVGIYSGFNLFTNSVVKFSKGKLFISPNMACPCQEAKIRELFNYVKLKKG